MNLPLKRIIEDVKQPLIIFLFFIISCLLFFFSPLSLTDSDEFAPGSILIDMLFICSILTAFIASYFKFSRILSRKQQQFYFQGKDNRLLKFISPLLSIYVVFILIDVLTLIVYFAFNVPEALRNSTNSYLLIDSFNSIILKYCITTIIFFLHYLSSGIKELIMGSFISLLCIQYIYSIFFSGNIMPLISIVLLITTSYFLYLLKYRKHNFELFKAINYGFILTLVIMFWWLYFVGKPYFNYNYTFTFNNISINIIYFILLLIFVIVFTKRNTNKLFKKEYFIILYVAPLILGGMLYNYDNSINKDSYVISAKQKELYVLINNANNDVYGSSDRNLQIKNESTENLKRIYKDLKKKIKYEVISKEQSKINTKYLDENNLLVLSFIDETGENSYNGIIEKNKFYKVLDKYGYKRAYLYNFLDYSTNIETQGFFIGNDEKLLKGENNWLKNVYFKKMGYNSVESIVSEDLYDRMEKLKYISYLDYDKYSYDNEIVRYEVIYKDNLNYVGYLQNKCDYNNSDKNERNSIIQSIKKEVR